MEIDIPLRLKYRSYRSFNFGVYRTRTYARIGVRGIRRFMQKHGAFLKQRTLGDVK